MSLRKSTAHKHAIVFDIETEPFTKDFQEARSIEERLNHCPKIRLSCVYNTLTRKYRFYTPIQCRELIRALLKAHKIVTYNGEKFDLLVLRQHGGLTLRQLEKLQKKHVDLYDCVLQDTGCSYKLDQLARLNLGEKKKVHGRDMAQLDLKELEEANRSDVSQTYRLWSLWMSGKLIFPYRFPSRGFRYERFAPDGPHSLLPPGDYIDMDTDDMSEGQLADYLAGTWGVTEDGELIGV